MTACVEHYAVLHTQEVTGSSPAVSTKKFLISQEIRNFFCLCLQIVTRHFGVFRLTQTVTQKPRDQESTGEGRMASSVPLRLFCGLHGLADDAADGIGGGTLHSFRGVGVGAEGKARIVVSQGTGQRLDVHAVLEGQRGEGVPLRYNNDKQKKPLFSRGLSVCRLLFNSFSKLKIDENYKEKRRLFY